jgi:hypothetical protein
MQLADARVSERPLFSERDRWFESAFLQRRVTDEPGSARSPDGRRLSDGRQAPPQTRKGLAFRGRQAPIAMRELKTWIDAAKKKLHDNVLGIALANKLARIAWAVLNKERAFECVKTRAKASEPA